MNLLQAKIAQGIVLVTHGNAFLAGEPLDDFWPGHKAFQFDESVEFCKVEIAGFRTTRWPIARNPILWLERLKKKECAGLRLFRVGSGRGDREDREDIGFAGQGGRWIIESIEPKGSRFWEANSKHVDRDGSGTKPWRVRYDLVTIAEDSERWNGKAVEELAAELDEALKRAIDFSDRHNLDWFRDAYQSGRDILAGRKEPDLDGLALLGQLPPEGARLMAASGTSYFFGGMGSWNDLGFAGPEGEVYEALSDDLFRLINSSLQAAANLTYQPG